MPRCLLPAILALCVVFAVALSAQSKPSAPHTFNVRDFGASGNGTSLDTAAIRSAVRAVADSGGGTLVFPAGRYLTGTFELLSNVTLDLQPGAVISGSKDIRDYGKIGDYGLDKNYGVSSSGEGELVGIIVARNAENIAIVGRGVIDGNGDDFMDLREPHVAADFDAEYVRRPEAFSRAVRDIEYGPVEPKLHGAGRPGTMIIFMNCRNVLVRDVTLRNAPNWTLHLQQTEQAVITGLHIVNNPLIPNNDGIDCMGCRHVHVSDCDIRTGDDDFAIVNSEHVNVTNCSMSSRSSAIRLEATKFSTFENLSIESNRGIGVFHRGGETTDSVLFSNITMRTELMAGHWWGKAEPIYVAVSPCSKAKCEGGVRNVTFSNITAEAESGMLILGAPGGPVENLTLEGIQLHIRAPRPALANSVGGNFDLRWTATRIQDGIFRHDIPAVYCRHVSGLKIHGLQLQWGNNLPEYFSDGVYCEDFRDISVEGFEGRQSQDESGAALAFANGTAISINTSKALPGTNTFLRLSNVTERRLGDLDLAAAKRAVVTDTPVARSGAMKQPTARPRAARKHRHSARSSGPAAK